LERLCLGGHEEARIAADLPELRVTETVLDDGVDEAEGHRMILHLGLVQVVEQEGRALFDHDSVIPPIKRGRGLQCNLGFEVGSRKQVASDEHELQKNLLQLLSVSVYYLVFLESFQLAYGATGHVAGLVFGGRGVDESGCLAVDEVDFVSVDDAVVLALDSEVVGDQFDRSFVRGCHP